MKNIIKELNRKIAYIGFKYFPKFFLKATYRIKMGRKLNLNNPKSLSDKINYLNLYEKNDLAIKCADKLKVREYIKEKGLESYLVQLLEIYDEVENIDFNKLPKKFAMKCNHGCGYNIICQDKNKLDINKSKKMLNKWIKDKYGYRGGEYHYNHIEPKIIVEEYIEGLNNEKLPIDYKIHCFNGEPVFTLCCLNREDNLKLVVYDNDWNHVDAIIEKYATNKKVDRPKDFDNMLKIARELSKPFIMLRVDFYQLEQSALIGELTYTPAAGRPNYFKKEFDEFIGKKIKNII